VPGLQSITVNLPKAGKGKRIKGKVKKESENLGEREAREQKEH